MKFSKAEIEAVIAASPRITVPFSKLILSQDYQVRASGSTSKMSIAELAASIKESSVLQNLIVVKGAHGVFEVCAGGCDDSLVSLPSPKTRPLHSEKLVRRLTAHRVAAVQAELIDRPDVALAAITAQLAQKVFRDNDHRYYRLEPVFAITTTDSQFDLRSAADDMEASAAWAKIEAERATWAERLPSDLDAVFPWLLEQNQTTILQLLTFVVAVTTTGIRGTESERQSNDALAQALGLDMRKWWTATGPSYFNHVSKGRILEVVTAAVDANAASPLAALKKEAAVAGAEQTVVGTGWLPSVLRVLMPEAASSMEDADEQTNTHLDEAMKPDEGVEQTQEPALAG